MMMMMMMVMMMMMMMMNHVDDLFNRTFLTIVRECT